MLLPLLMASCLPTLAAAEQVSAEAVQAEAELQAEIRHWIEMLGNDSYAKRVRAKKELRRLGLTAFDLLHQASTHEDSEVAIAARHLISSLQINWADSSDPPPVKEIMEDYGTSGNEAERKTRIGRLAQVPNRAGLAALCRLVRYETSLRLSRDAALLIMQQPQLPTAVQRTQSADTIISLLGANQRPASVWLRVYADDLRRGVYDAQRWSELIDRERSLVDGRRSLQTDTEAVLELVRVCAVRAQDANNQAEAMRLAMETLEMIPPGRNELIEAATWALDHQLDAVVIKMQQRQPIPFSKEPLLLYAVAEAYLGQDDPQQADELAEQALSIDRLPAADSEEAQNMTRDARENLALRHREIGVRLQGRGQFEWAINEYRHIVDSLEIDVVVAAVTRQQLARLYGSMQEHQAVLDMLLPLQQRMQNDAEYQRRLQNTNISPSSLAVVIMHHRGLLFAEQNQVEKAQQSLANALALSNRNADILIAMYRLPGEEEWRSKVRRELDAMTTMFEEYVFANERDYRESNSPTNAEQLATALNQYAWLVSNTEGDYRRALRYSQRSLELQPDDPMLLDTCGRCYFAIGDYKNAVRLQTRAVKLGGEDPAVHRQLKEFQAALDASAESSS
ncbi:tetratricopeptide repeat protein [Roseimaritima ulvae]|uniref:Tetratricopeptide repeat protein n=1 Tax=Roseimaritima ulvae TaxID=980254 RepID=A0A5B9QQ67_9BACT|nr:hypothetical protein [Roseimaritima ulvae]QEG40052.1 Tetratricopeptide repeat protein [Roseimaritima ulvae]